MVMSKENDLARCSLVPGLVSPGFFRLQYEKQGVGKAGYKAS